MGPSGGIRPWKGVLDWPARGTLVETFGRHRHPKFDTWTVSNGIALVRAGGNARARGLRREGGLRAVARRVRQPRHPRSRRRHADALRVAAGRVRDARRLRGGRDGIGTAGIGPGRDEPGVYFEVRDRQKAAGSGRLAAVAEFVRIVWPRPTPSPHERETWVRGLRNSEVDRDHCSSVCYHRHDEIQPLPLAVRRRFGGRAALAAGGDRARRRRPGSGDAGSFDLFGRLLADAEQLRRADGHEDAPRGRLRRDVRCPRPLLVLRAGGADGGVQGASSRPRHVSPGIVVARRGGFPYVIGAAARIARGEGRRQAGRSHRHDRRQAGAERPPLEGPGGARRARGLHLRADRLPRRRREAADGLGPAARFEPPAPPRSGSATSAIVKIPAFTPATAAAVRKELDEAERRADRESRHRRARHDRRGRRRRGAGRGALRRQGTDRDASVPQGRRRGRSKRPARRSGRADGRPAIDDSTAGAAEIFAAALHDRASATTVGETTVGMAIVQRHVPTAEGGSLFMTVGRYVSPSGQVLGGKGLTPDERVLVLPGERPRPGPDPRPRPRDRPRRRRSGAQGRLAPSAS